MLEKVFDAPWSRLFTFIVFVAGAMSPAMLFVAVYCPEFFQKTDFSKLVILSIAIILPLAVINLTVSIFAGKYAPLDKDGQLTPTSVERFVTNCILGASFAAIVPFSGSTLFHVFFRVGGIRTGIIIALALNFVQMAPFWLGMWWCSPLTWDRGKTGDPKSAGVSGEKENGSGMTAGSDPCPRKDEE